jgi:outer membrane receptor protein involved in Fe transport
MRLENKWNSLYKIFVLISLFVSQIIFAGQTGKLNGKIIDSETKEGVIGANVIVEGTYLGAAADVDGYYYINNIPPGVYNVVVTAVGYRKTTIKNVKISIDLTTKVDVVLSSESVQLGGEVVVVAEKPLIIKDLTSSASTVSSKDIEMMPVDNLQSVINLQAGVVGGHFRGGRSNEVAYLIDGVPVTDAFSGTSALEVENASVRELEVISGTFNAEYGQAMSGIVNIVTKEGSQKYEGAVTAYFGNYIATNDGIFENLNRFNVNGVKDITLSISGPTQISRDLTFFATGRYFSSDGYLYGRRIYNIKDTDPFHPTGDKKFVSMNPYEKYSTNAKLAYSLPSWKFTYSAFYDHDKSKGYDHSFRWAPDGISNHYGDNFVNNLQISFVPSQSTFTSLKFSYNTHNFYGHLWADDKDTNYVAPNQGIPTSGYTYRFGGNQVGRYTRYTHTLIGQWSFESQVSKEHKVKVGIEGRKHQIYNHYREIVNITEGQVDDFGNTIFTLGYRNLHTPGNTSYYKEPYEFNAYLQDKMEYDIMIINAGLRFEYFNANSSYPFDLKNVTNNPNFPGAGKTRKATAKTQLSPRLGVSFPISDQGAIYFSYGHFFQIPPLENLYVNDEYIINQGQSLSSTTGNPDLKAQKTVQYEIGLQQVVFPNVALDLTVYYRDIRNLLGMEIINTYEGFKYARFINRDYGNTKGIIVSLDKRFTDYFAAKIDYTYQIAEGNASDPMAVFNNNQSDPPIETEKHLVPLDWDQRSTINFTGTVGVPGDWTVSVIFQYGSGMPYTEDQQISNGVRFENGGRKPVTMNLDLKADKNFSLFGLNVNTFLLVYNVFDIRNEYGVYATTGRATFDLNTKYAGEINGLNTIEQYIKNPAMYSAPREVRVGFRVGF